MKQLELAANGESAAKIWSVGELVSAVALDLDTHFGRLWVEGEVSNLNQHRSGHVYFTLKDEDAQVDAVMWRSDVKRLKFRLEDGLVVRCRGRLSIYPERGRFQLYVEAAEPKGLGELQIAFEQLKAALSAEGLFAPERKRPLPFLPHTIGLVTSPSGAAVRDFIRVATRRFPARILISPASVQGEGAASEIRRAMAWLEARPEVEVIVLTRGGGSLEDLWAFNDEMLARAIAACGKPVVSAVGHEVDFTIADFVADLRAPTPSAAAELLVPEAQVLTQTLSVLCGRFARAMRHCLRDARQRLDERLSLADRMLARQLEGRRHALLSLRARLAALHPRERVVTNRALLAELTFRLTERSRDVIQSRRMRLASLAGKLDAMSPLRVLDRGYSIVRTSSGKVVTDAVQAHVNDRVQVRLRRGELDCRVEEVRAESTSSSSSNE